MQFLPSSLRSRRTSAPPSAAVSTSSSSTSQPTVYQSLRAVVCSSWLNVLLVFIPIAWIFHFVKPDSDTLIFVFSFLAIVPLAAMLAFATDELSMRLNQTLAGLINATLGNAVELIVAILALIKCELQVVQSSLIGSILSNILLVLGMCFLAGGTRFSEQGFSLAAVQINSSLLMLSVVAVLIPAGVHVATLLNATQKAITSGSATLESESDFSDILRISRGVAILLLLIYVAYLVFQLWSHKDLYDDKDSIHVPKSIKWGEKRISASSVDSISPIPTITPSSIDVEATRIPTEPEEEEEQPKTSLAVCIATLIVVTVLVGVTSEFLVGSIDGLSTSTGLPKEFVGLILLPIVGNAAEHATAVTVSVKDKLTLSCQVAIGSAIQIAIFVIPLLVTIAWIMGKPLTLYFDPLESIVLLLSVLTVNYVVADGKSNWLEGCVLIMLYVIIGTTVFFYNGTEVLIACSS